MSNGEAKQVEKQEPNRITRARLMKEEHTQHITRLKNYKRVLIQTSEMIRSELPNTDYLIRLLEKIQTENLNELSFNQFCRDRIGIKDERLRALLKAEVRMSKEDIEKILIYLGE